MNRSGIAPQARLVIAIRYELSDERIRQIYRQSAADVIAKRNQRNADLDAADTRPPLHPARLLDDAVTAVQKWLGQDKVHGMRVIVLRADSSRGGITRYYYETIGVNRAEGVHTEPEKKYTNPGWMFYSIRVSDEQFARVTRRLQQAMGPPPATYNTMGLYCFYCFPVSGRGRSYFCSELVAAVLHDAGILGTADGEPHTVTPDAIGRILYDKTRTAGSGVMQLLQAPTTTLTA